MPEPPAITTRRVYDSPVDGEGLRVLVDRLWPRGLRREDLAFDRWEKRLAPSSELRKWFAHDPQRFAEFRERYLEELAAVEAAARELLAEAAEGPMVLLYSAKDTEHNQAVVLRDFLLSLETGAG